MTQQVTSNGNTIYDVGVQELRKVSVEESARKMVESEFMEARGRETARLHVTLKALTEQDRRNAESSRMTLAAIDRLSSELADRAAQLHHLVESFETEAGKRFNGVHDDLRQRAEAISREIGAFVAAERDHFETIRREIGEFRNAATTLATEQFNAVTGQLGDARATIVREVQEARSAASNQIEEARAALTTQAEGNFTALAKQGRESAEHLTQDVRVVRDEIVRLVDSRMNQADASFAALRGDLEVVKFLVMDIIKDRIGRNDPKQKPF